MKHSPLIFHRLALAGFLGLFILLMLWHTQLALSPRFPIALVLIIQVTPLLLPLRGFLNGHRKNCAWIGFISLFYFIHGVVEAYSNESLRLYASLEIVFSLMMFFGVNFYLRFSSQ